MKEHVLVTGGAGYIGSILVPELLGAGYQVTVLDNLKYQQASLSHVCHHPNLDIVIGDVRTESTVSPLLKRTDIIIPLAALVGAPLCDYDPIGAVTTNQDAIVNIVKKLSKSQRILIPNTNSGYGVGKKGSHCTEDSPLKPISL